MKSQNKKNEELQSRRQFFRKAAKGALPILGAVVLANIPLVSNAAPANPTACTGTCYGTCSHGCKGCQYTCQGTCSGSCKGTCKWSAR